MKKIKIAFVLGMVALVTLAAVAWFAPTPAHAAKVFQKKPNVGGCQMTINPDPWTSCILTGFDEELGLGVYLCVEAPH